LNASDDIQSTPAVSIRIATAEDAHRLSELAARTFIDTFARDNSPEDMAMYVAATFTPERQLRELRDPAQRVLLVERDGEAVGYAQLVEGPAPRCVTGDAPVELARFYVDRAWHGRGIARALMRRALDEAARLGGRTLWLGVWERNARAIAFYGREGFVDVGAREFVLGHDVQTDRLMRRPVAATASG
jgi:ribosomal protein S18 acetylase RimI-like enzyme